MHSFSSIHSEIYEKNKTVNSKWAGLSWLDSRAAINNDTKQNVRLFNNYTQSLLD